MSRREGRRAKDPRAGDDVLSRPSNARAAARATARASRAACASLRAGAFLAAAVALVAIAAVSTPARAEDAAGADAAGADAAGADAAGTAAAGPSAAERITLRLDGAPVSDALAAVAERFGLDLVASGADGRTVTVSLVDRTLDEALDAVLAGSDLAGIRSGSMLRIVPGDRTVSQAFPLEHATASRVAGTLKEAFTDAQIVGDDGSNLLYVTANAMSIARIASMLAWIDQSPGQVKIRARVLEVALNKETALGIDWESFFERGETSIDLATDLFPATAAGTTLRISNNGDDATLDAVVRSIATRTHSRLLSSPEIVTANNEPAKILVGERVPYTKASTTTQTGSTLQEIAFVDVGVKLETTPQVSADGTVSMTVGVEISEVLDKEVAGTPRIGTREAHTRVSLDSGDVLMIGGLMRTNEVRIRRGIPFLGEIPYLGRLFRHEGTREEKTELVILVSPERVDPAYLAASRKRSEGIESEGAALGAD